MTEAAADRILTLAEVAARDSTRPVALVLGVFDGVHRGHRVLLSAVREAAAARGARSVALVFDPPPIEVIRPGQKVERLAPVSENLARIREAGVDPVPIRFDASVRDLPPEAFLEALAPGLRTAAIVMTAETAFGRDRAGTPSRMAEIGASRGYEVVLVDPELDDGPISSTRIRRALAEGDIPAATRLLARRPSLSGEVVRGDGRGQSLGYPTANLAFQYRPALPALGIYAGLVPGVPGATGALISVGHRPTFHDQGDLVVEANLLDWSGELYGQHLRIELVGRLRDERRFETAAGLTAQMRRDEVAARAALVGIV
ncbi:MAG: riboflavin biosynthesis protein RibF [Candidatus Limnocylindria bacterium]